VNVEQDLQEGQITIALAVYNGEKTIEKAVRSILEQSYRNFELYVVEDGSTDNTFDILQSILPEDNRMHVVRMAKNAGTYSAKNLILKHFCHSEFFAHQDADDFSWKPRLEEQIKFMGNHAKIAACGTGIDEFYRDESESPTIVCDEVAEFNPEDNYFHRKNLYTELLPIGICFGVCLDETVKTKLAMNGSLMFRTRVLNELGGFDGRAYLSADTDMLWRILANYSVANLHRVLYSRLFHRGSMTKSPLYGFGSEKRVTYMKDSRNRLRRAKPLYEQGRTEELTQKLKNDMFVADIEFKVFDGGVQN
jgi:glycosyltransferase involved in cell wall biosynthesis